jgi:hypothetical protein
MLLFHNISTGGRNGHAKRCRGLHHRCLVCYPVVEMVQRLAFEKCNVTVYNLKDDLKAFERAKAAGVQRVPMVLVDDQPSQGCQSAPVTEIGLRATGIGA